MTDQFKYAVEVLKNDHARINYHLGLPQESLRAQYQEHLASLEAAIKKLEDQP